MKKTRREFIKIGALTSVAFAGSPMTSIAKNNNQEFNGEIDSKVISTWKFGEQANKVAWNIISNGGSSINAVEQGVRVVESDPKNHTVGIGGYPDRNGIVTLDACIMDHNNQCGAVAFLKDIENPISVARKVMDETPHVFLVGEGALEFAVSKGFEQVNLLTEEAEIAYKKWMQKSKYQPVINIENHDTIATLAIDKLGNLSGACTTSGMAYKIHGRVGDSPIIGAGLFVDNGVGAAAATGVGEEVIKVAGASIIVELMRQGMDPQSACKEVIQRIIKNNKDLTHIQVGFIALNKNGDFGSWSIRKGFKFAVQSKGNKRLINSSFSV